MYPICLAVLITRMLDVYKRQTHVRPERLMKTLFTDEAYVKANVDEARLMRRLFDLACNMQSHDTDMQLYSLFTDEEC